MRADHFIPLPRERIAAALLEETGWPAPERAAFEQFSRLYTGLYVLRLHERLQSLKRRYAPFDPDGEWPADGEPGDAALLLGELDNLLRQANFSALGGAEIARSLESVSPYGLEVGVDMSDFEQLRVYCLGRTVRLERKRDWRSLWLRVKQWEVPVFRRLVVCVRFKPFAERVAETVAAGESERRARRRLRRARDQLPEAVERGCMFLRLFKDIPHSDLETLFPNRRVRMRRSDKIKLGITGGGGTASGVAATLTKLAAAVSPLAIAGALVGLALVIFRQVTKVVNQRTKYMAVLTRSLYFHCLDNNFGVIARLVDSALEEECKEILLAYCFLVRARAGEYDEAQLDRAVETYVQQRFAVSVDFDVADGVRKLREDGLLTVDGSGKLHVKALAEALETLQARWSSYALRDPA